MNIDFPKVKTNYFTPKDYSLICQVLNFIASDSDDKKYLNKITPAFQRLLRKMKNDKIEYLPHVFADIEAKLKDMNRKLV